MENMIRYRRFRIKFWALKKKEIENRISRFRDIGNLSCENVEKTSTFDNFFRYYFFKNLLRSVITKQNMFSKALFFAESGYVIKFRRKSLV